MLRFPGAVLIVATFLVACGGGEIPRRFVPDDADRASRAYLTLLTAGSVDSAARLLLLGEEAIDPRPGLTGGGGAIEDRNLRLAAGDTVRFLEYYGDAFWAVAHYGRVVLVEEFWPRPGLQSPSDDGQPAMTLSAPEVAQWLRLQPRHGIAGWWQEESSKTARLDWQERCAPPS